MRSRVPFRLAAGVVLAAALTACGESWPDAPPVDEAQYKKDYEAWREGQRETAIESTKIVGVWSLESGDTPFGSDRSLPVVLPAPPAPSRAGVFQRAGETISVVPARGVPLTNEDGGAITSPAELQGELRLGSLRLFVIPMNDGRHFLTVVDDEHQALKDLPDVQTYAVEGRWRVAARFDAFDAPRMTKVADVRGGATEYPAVGRLTFRIAGQQHQLTAFGFPDSEDFFVLFKDATNGTTTYGYRILTPRVVASGGWTVLDFNVARNPPCAYSPYTTCPLPPPENRLAAAIEAGEKQFPTGRGFVQQ